MATAIILAAILSGQALSTHHVRSSEPRITALLNAGLVRSTTFQRLVETLDRSDVIVYVDPKLTRPALGGYLSHTIVIAGEVRYLHIAIDVQGAEGRVVPLLAHELQHAVEIAGDRSVRDSKSVDTLFERLGVKFGCGGTTCVETQAAKDVEARVGVELKSAH